MKNRRNEDLTSFELLLDTMCNAFGGIVFIALLLAIFSQAIELNQLKDAELSHSSSLQPPSSISQFHQLPGGKTMNKFLQLIHETKRLQDILLNTYQEELAKTLEADGNRIAVIENRIRAVEKRIEYLNQKVKILQNQKERTLRLPRLHVIEKLPVFIAVQHGRLYAVSDLSVTLSDVPATLSGHRGYDLSDVRMREHGNRISFAPIPGRGQSIEQGAERSGRLRDALTNIDRDREFISFAVFPDSFGEFNQVKSIFLEHGFEYNWLIIREQISIVRGKGGNGMHVQ